MTIRTPPWPQQGTGVLNTAESVREFNASIFGWNPFASFAGGVEPAHDGSHGIIRGFTTTANGTPNMSVNVSSGTAMVTGTEAGDQAAYFAGNDATVNLPIDASDPSLSRRDLVCIRVRDQEYSGANSDAHPVIVKGTAASVPVDPGVPNNHLVIGRVRVGAAAGSITSTAIDDLRTWASSTSIARCKSSKRPPNPQPGQLMFEMDTDKVYVRNALNTIWYEIPTHAGIDSTAFFVGRSTGQVVGGSTVSQINAMTNSAVAGLLGPFNTTTQVYTAPYAGLYHFFTQWHMGAFIGIPQRVMSMLYLNGSERYRDNTYTPSNDEIGLSSDFMVPLTAGTTVSFRVYHDYGGNKTFDNCRFGGRLMVRY